MEPLESRRVRPRQLRYQAALRPDPTRPAEGSLLWPIFGGIAVVGCGRRARVLFSDADCVPFCVLCGVEPKFRTASSRARSTRDKRPDAMAERFRLTIATGGLPLWRIAYHESSFEET